MRAWPGGGGFSIFELTPFYDVNWVMPGEDRAFLFSTTLSLIGIVFFGSIKGKPFEVYCDVYRRGDKDLTFNS